MAENIKKVALKDNELAEKELEKVSGGVPLERVSDGVLTSDKLLPEDGVDDGINENNNE